MQNKFSDELYGYTTSAIPRHFSPVKGRLYKDSFTMILRTETLGFRTKFQLLVASKPWFRKFMCQKKKKAKQKNVSFFPFLVWGVIKYVVIWQALYDRGHSGSMCYVVYAHPIMVIFCKHDQSQQCQELCLGRMWAETAYPCSHEGLNPETSSTHISVVCQRSCGLFGGWTIDDSKAKKGESVT